MSAFYAPGIPVGHMAPIQAASYDSARTTKLNERHWAIGPQVSDPTPEQRATLRNRTRYEVANNSLLEGMVETYARDLVGSGPHPTFREFGSQRRELQAAWKDWAGSLSLGSLMKTIARTYLIDGECFLLSIEEPPYVRIIEAERIISPLMMNDSSMQPYWPNAIPGPSKPTQKREQTIEGIEYLHGVPIHYYVDGGNGFSADVVTHLFKQQFANQRRGVPRPAPSLDMHANIRRTNQACVISYETVAKISLVLQAKMLSAQTTGRPFETIDLVPGSAITLPEGYELGQVKAEHPMQSHRDAVAMFVCEAARCFPMPLNKALGTSQDSNFASGSLDNIDYERAIGSDQVLLAERLVQRLVAIFLMLQGLEYQRCFIGWDSIPHLNPDKQFGAIEKKLAMRLTSRTREAAKLGEDWEDINEELEREEQAMGTSQNEPGDNINAEETDDENEMDAVENVQGN